MGIKTGTRIIAPLILSLCVALPVHASTVDELYDYYGKEYIVEIPNDVSETIKQYNAAKKYVSMYHYVINSEYDVSILETEKATLEKELEVVRTGLHAGYNKTIGEIYALENRYLEIKGRLSNISDAMNSYEVPTASLSVNNVPSYSDYKVAMKRKNELLSQAEIGVVPSRGYPLQSQCHLEEHSKAFTRYATINNTGVTAMFNGVVKEIKNDADYGLTLIIDHYNGVLSYYCNLEEVTVKVGETLYQGQQVGYIIDSTAIFRLSLSGEFVDVSTLFVEGALNESIQNIRN